MNRVRELLMGAVTRSFETSQDVSSRQRSLKDYEAQIRLNDIKFTSGSNVLTYFFICIPLVVPETNKKYRKYWSEWLKVSFILVMQTFLRQKNMKKNK